MKKSKMMIVAGAFLALTLVLGMQQEDNKMYEKKRSFSSSSEILEELNNKSLRAYDTKSGRNKEKDEVLECFSQRKRLTDTDLNYSKMEIKEIVQLSEKQENTIVDRYNSLRKNYTKANPVSKTEAVRIKVQPYYMEYSGDGQEKYIQRDDLVYMNLIFVDEGEGMVIDYIKESDQIDSIEG